MNKRLSCLLIALILLAGCACAHGDGRQTLRVGYIDYPGFIEPQSDGTCSGYAAEYLTRIADYTGYHYEYVYGNWSELLTLLEKGGIDLLCSAQYTAARAERYDYTAYPIGYTQGLLYTRAGNDRLLYEDFAMFDGMSVGILRGSAMAELFAEYASQNGFACDMTEYSSESKLLEALEAGRIDAMCSEHLANHKGLSLLAMFGADAYYIISHKGSPFIGDINVALRQIKADVDYEAELYHKYYDTSAAATTLQFTSAEKAYIQTRGTITVGMNTDRAPMSYVDPLTGGYKGICYDMMQEIAQRSGLSFSYVPQASGRTTPQMLGDGQYDIICGVERDNFVTSETSVATSAFLESPVVPVGRAGLNLDLSNRLRAAVPAAFQALRKRLESNYPNLELIFYANNHECLNAVATGDADIFIQNSHIISLLLQEPKYDGLATLPLEVMTEHTALALRRDSDPTLLSILNKCLASIDQATITSSLITHTFASPYQYTPSDFFYKFRTQILLTAVLTALCFGLLICVIIVRHRSELKLQKTNRQLAEAVVQADRASVAKSQFLSRMSHEIRTPMNAIVGLTEIAKQHHDSTERVDSCLDQIATSSRVLLGIINDVLDMSAIESNKLQIAHVEFDLTQVLDDVRAIYSPQCHAKGVALKLSADVQSGLLIGDPLRLNQILMNLVSNAFKFTGAGGEIALRVSETERKGVTTFIRFTVSDTGCGISPEMLSRLFQPFEQETADTAQKYGGSGLGLSIAKNLVDMMHGAIRTTSQKGVGTTFVVDLPFERAQREEARQPQSAAYDFTGHRVLLAEDMPLNAEIAIELLRLVSMDADLAADGQQAVQMFAASPCGRYDAILMDVQMPVMDGYQAARAIRALDRPDAKTIPIYAMTANAFTEDVSAALSAGMDGHISKPINTRHLYEALQNAVHKAERP